MADLASENHHLAKKIADHMQFPDIPGMLWRNLHTCLAWERDMSLFYDNLENQIGKGKAKSFSLSNFQQKQQKNNLSAQTKDLILKFFAMEKSSKPWNKWSI